MLFEELKSRKPEQDESVPYEKNGYRYRWRFRAGDQYRVWLRQPTPHSLGPGKPCWMKMRWLPTASTFVWALAVSPDGSKLAFSTDSSGSEHLR